MPKQLGKRDSEEEKPTCWVLEAGDGTEIYMAHVFHLLNPVSTSPRFPLLKEQFIIRDWEITLNVTRKNIAYK